MKYFTVIYEMPRGGLEEWMQKPESERADAEARMKAEWDAWMAAHADQVLNTVAFGTAKVVSADGVKDEPNGMMMSSYVQAESADAAARLFEGHPHFGIPGATITVMEAVPLDKADEIRKARQ